MADERVHLHLRRGVALLLALLFVGAGWVIAHRVSWHPRAARLWSERDLPALPADRENGWVMANAAGGWLDRDVVPLGLREPLADPQWPRLRSLAGPIRQLLAEAAVREWEAISQSALAAPRFADACELGVEARCHHTALLRLHDVAALGAVSAALDGRWSEGLARAGRLLRADSDLMNTSRSALSALAARRCVRRDLALLGALLDGVEREPRGRLAGLRANLQEVAAQLEPSSAPDADGRRAVITEYLLVTGALRSLAAAPSSGRRAAPVNRLLLDEERTLSAANRYFERLEQFASDPATREPPALRRYRGSGFGWWLYNPAGKLMLNAALLDLAPALRDMAAQKAEIAALRGALRTRVAALLAR